AGGGQAPTVGAEGYAPDVAGVALKDVYRLPAGGVPEPRRPVVFAGGGQARAVWAERDAAGGGAVALQAEELPAGDRGPDLHLLAPPASIGGNQAFAVGAERHAGDRLQGGLQREQGPPAHAVPHVHRPVDLPGRGNAQAVGAEDRPRDGAGVLAEGL